MEQAISREEARALLPTGKPVHSFCRALGSWCGGELSTERADALIATGARFSEECALFDHYLKVDDGGKPLFLECDMAAVKRFKSTFKAAMPKPEGAPGPGMVVPAPVLEAHHRYCDFRQDEDLMTEAFLALNHPFIAPYRELRQFFDSLSYACNSSARYFAWVAEKETAEYWAPRLYCAPSSAAYDAHDLPYRDGGAGDFARACATALYADGINPRLDAGTWNVWTSSSPTRQFLVSLAGQDGVEFVDTPVHSTGIRVSLKGPAALVHHQAIVEHLTWAMSSGILPRREPDPLEAPELPLASKMVTFGQVERVTVDARRVLIPLVALDRADGQVLAIAEDLIALIQDGLPFANCLDWFQRFLTPTAVVKLQQQFGAR